MAASKVSRCFHPDAAGAAFGLGSLVLAHASVLLAVKVCGAAFLLWLAWKIATAAPSSGQERVARPISFWQAALFHFEKQQRKTGVSCQLRL